MKKLLNKTFSVLFILLSLTFSPIESLASTTAPIFNNFLATQQKQIINYEKSQPSAIDNPVVDPNFNVMRTTDMESSSTATYIVVALLIIASIVPLATWYFSRSSTN
tara:strand:- start:1079 stop:1399 length:321 start_codon:yes stop_codon:yes gene_type:complete